MNIIEDMPALKSKKMKYDLVIFDLDGTLIDTIEDLGAAANFALEENGCPQHNIAEYRKMVGHGIRNLIINALPEAFKTEESVVDKCLKSFVEYYSVHIDVHTRPYEGIHELLRSLQDAGTALAVASNKFQAGTEKLVAEFFPDIRFAAILGNAPDRPLKPDAAIIHTAIKAAFGDLEDVAVAGSSNAIAGVPGIPGKLRIAMVGDSATDIRTAVNGGVEAIAVTWGFRSRAELETLGTGTLVDSVSSLRAELL